MAFARDTHGRAPIGIAQRRGWAYPFVEPSADVRYLFADLYLQYEDPADYDATLTPYSLPLRLVMVRGLGTQAPKVKPSNWPQIPEVETHAADLVVMDCQNRVVVATQAQSLTFQSRAWGDRLQLYDWTSERFVLRAVVHTKWPPDGIEPLARNYPSRFYPADGRLDERGLLRMPKRVRSVVVGLTTIEEEFELDAGFNIVLEHTGTLQQISSLDEAVAGLTAQAVGGGRKGNKVTVIGTPGGGRGRFPGCDDVDIVLRRINGEEPNDYGDFLFQVAGKDGTSAQSCYWLERPTTVVSEQPRVLSVTPAALQINNDCDPCCECADYVEVKKAIDRVWAQWRGMGIEAEDIRDLYATSRDRWLEQKACREARPQRLTLTSSCNGFVGFSYTYCHMSDVCDGPLETTFDIETFRNGASTALDNHIFPGRTRKNEGSGDSRLHPYTMQGSLPSVKAYWEALDSHKSARLVALFHVCDAQDGDAFRITATPVFKGVTGTAQTETVALLDPCVDEDPC